MSKMGRPFGSKKNPFLDQLNIAVNEPINPKDPKSIRKLRLIADKLVSKAVEGESWAVKEVADRLDGKPAQVIDATIEDNRKKLAEYSDDELYAFLTEGDSGRASKEETSKKDVSGVRPVH